MPKKDDRLPRHVVRLPNLDAAALEKRGAPRGMLRTNTLDAEATEPVATTLEPAPEAPKPARKGRK